MKSISAILPVTEKQLPEMRSGAICNLQMPVMMVSLELDKITRGVICLKTGSFSY
jgi:hypothetical protein